MNKFKLLSLLLILFLGAKAQDRIINIQHDTVYCSISSINNERILYELKNKDGSVTGKFINLSQVLEYTRTPKADIYGSQFKYKPQKLRTAPDELWRFGLNIGGSYMPWFFDNIESSSSMPDYYNKFKSGYHINSSVHYMISNSFGVGAEYSFFNSNVSGSYPIGYSSSIYLMLSENYREYFNYLGPSVVFQQSLDRKRKLIMSETLSVGAMFIRMESERMSPYIDYSGYSEITNNSLLTGNSLSAKLGLAVDYKIYPKLSVGLGADLLWGSLKKARTESNGTNSSSPSDEQELNEPLNMSRIDYAVVLRYHF